MKLGTFQFPEREKQIWLNCGAVTQSQGDMMRVPFPDVCLFNFLLKCLQLVLNQKQWNFKQYYSSLIFVGKIFGIHANYFIAEVEFFEGEDSEEPSDDNNQQEQQQDQVRKTYFQGPYQSFVIHVLNVAKLQDIVITTI